MNFTVFRRVSPIISIERLYCNREKSIVNGWDGTVVFSMEIYEFMP